VKYDFFMKERILEFLKAENKSSAQFAEEIGVQPSGISHILSGRNNPSLDFILKMLDKYKYLSTEWLLFGRGQMYSSNQNADLFNDTSRKDTSEVKMLINVPSNTDLIPDNDTVIKKSDQTKTSGVVKIVWFYANNTFREFFPE